MSVLASVTTHRELIENLVVRDIKARYKQSVLGIAWTVLNPLAMAFIYMIIGAVFWRQKLEIPFVIFAYYGLLFWNLFASGVTGAAESLIAHDSLITKVNLQPFVATLATLLFTRGLALSLAGGAPVATSGGSGFRDAEVFGVPVSVLLMVALFLIGAGVVRYTGFGRYVLAVGGNEDASRLMGLPVDRTKALVYVISGVLAGLAGAVYAGQNASVATGTGQGYELVAIAAVVVGGTLLTGGVGSVLSSLVGVLLLQLILNLIIFENGLGRVAIGAEWAEVVQGLFLLLVVLLQVALAGRRKASG